MGFLDKLKDVANKVGDTVEQGAKNASESVKKAQEKSKLNKEIAEAEKTITATYTEIGKKFFEENPYSEAYADFYTLINDANAKIAKLKEKLAELEDSVTCKNCGASVAKGSNFCDKCGAKIEVPVVETVEPEIVEEANKTEETISEEPTESSSDEL